MNDYSVTCIYSNRLSMSRAYYFVVARISISTVKKEMGSGYG